MADFRNEVENTNETRHTHAGMHIEAEVSAITWTDADTYEQLTTGMVNGTSVDFTLLNGTLTCSSRIPKTVLFIGSANGKVDKQCDITFALYKNDEAVAGCVTTVQFTAQDRSKAFTCVKPITCESGDTFKVFAKTSDNTVSFDLQSFSIALWGC